ncbi:MAG: serine O-acetyltransferase [Oceanicoccus sp.]
MLSYLKDDLLRYVPNASLIDMLKVIIVSHAFHMVIAIRVGSQLGRLPVVGVVFRVLFEYFIRVFYASDISLKSKIGPGLMILHGHDIVIGSEVIIGQRCKIMNGVTLGNKDTEAGVNKHPVIGDDVVIGTGAKILGDVTVGNNSKVGANSVVLKDVEEGFLAVGVPARTRSLK